MRGFEQRIKVDEKTLSKCLVPFLDALGWVGKERTIKEARPHLDRDFDIVGFLNTMANLGFETHLKSERFENLSSQLFPVLAIDPSGKAMVILKREEDGILIYEGESGSYRQVDEIDATRFFLVYKTSSLHKRVFEAQKNWFFHIASRFKSIGLVVLILSIIIVLLALSTPLIVMGVYDVILNGNSLSNQWLLAVGIGIFVFTEGGLKVLRYFIMNYTGARLSNIVNNQVFRRILYLPPSYTESASVGSQVSRIKDFGTVKDFVEGHGVISILEAPFYLVLVVILVVIAGNLAYIPVVTVLLMLLLGAVLSPIVKQINEQSASNSMAKQEYIIDLINNFHHIKQVGGHELWKSRFKDFSADSSHSTYETSQINAVITSLSQMLISISGALIIGIGAKMVMEDTLSPGALVAALILSWRILGPIKQAFSVSAQSTRIKRSIGQLNRLMAIPIEKNIAKESVLSRPLNGKLRFQNVSIRYSNDAFPALLSVNLDIPQGVSMGIRGHDGAGKTTLFKLILGMYKPQSGRVLFDSLNIQQLNPIQVRHSIAYAPQTDTMFYGTIEQNLLFVKPDATQEQMEQAAKLSGLWDTMQLDKIDLKTRVGDNLSSGFRPSYNKLINLTRMFLKECNILLLDEPEQNLLNSQIDHLAQTLKNLRGKTTVLVITENPRLLEVMQNIAVLEKGRVVSVKSNKAVATPDQNQEE